MADPSAHDSLRIALAFPGCHRRGGVERILFECAHYLQSRGHQTTVFANEWENETPSNAGVASGAFESAFPFQTVQVQARRRPDFLYGKSFFDESSRRLKPNQFDALSTFGCVAPLGGVPWVQSVHAAWIERSQSLRGPFSWAKWRQKINPLHPVLLKLERLHFAGKAANGGPNYRKVIALTPEVSSDLQRIYGVPENDIVVIPNGFAPPEFSVPRAQSLREEMRRELGFQDDDRVLVFVANEAERKGLEPLLLALKILDDPKIKLLVVGRIPASTWQPVSEKMGLTSQVTFTGPSGDVGKYYAASDIFVLPTQYEPWGLVIVEAMACGLPVVTSRCAGAAEAVQEGKTGYLLRDPQDAEEIAGNLRHLLEGRHIAAQAIADSVQNYAWPRVLQRYEKVLLQNCR